MRDRAETNRVRKELLRPCAVGIGSLINAQQGLRTDQTVALSAGSLLHQLCLKTPSMAMVA